MVEGDRAVEVVHRDQAAVEAALGDRLGGALLRLGGEVVERLAGDAFERGDGVGAHALVRLRVDRLEVRVAGTHDGRQAPSFGERHHLGAAADDEVLHAGHDHAGREVVRRDARAAEAVERDAARLDVVAGVERGHAAEVAALLPDLELVPQMTSSTSAVSKPLRSASAASTVAARCCGCRWASAPLPCLPMPRGVRQASMIRASDIGVPLGFGFGSDTFVTNVRVSFSQAKTRLVTSAGSEVRSAAERAGADRPGRGGMMEINGARVMVVGGASGMARATAERVAAGGSEGGHPRPSRHRRGRPSPRRSVATSSNATSPTSRAPSRPSPRRSRRWAGSTSASTPPAAASARGRSTRTGRARPRDVPPGRRPQPDRHVQPQPACRPWRWRRTSRTTTTSGA